ncbi:MAG: hypothetical protein RR721_10720 [Aeromonas sp.]|uniref:hypothetical protein n=1 Tax=Aeromonas sp. TaxID=647 RepID=UPI002FCB063D
MNDLILTSFEEMVSTYKETLKNIYPARGSTGFTEANQVHIYTNSLVNTLGDTDAVSWLEFPWESKKQHIDSLVYSPKHQAIFYIEAKRIYSAKKKVEMINDIKRLYHSNRVFLQEHGITQYNSEYIIALSDVWLEKKWQKAIPAWWCTADRIPEQVKLWEQQTGKSLMPTDITIHDELITMDWDQSRPFAYWLGETCNNVKNYCLLMASLKIS